MTAKETLTSGNMVAAIKKEISALDNELEECEELTELQQLHPDRYLSFPNFEQKLRQIYQLYIIKMNFVLLEKIYIMKFFYQTTCL